MKNKKGFTLVELLAVIIILAIVALVVVPVVMGVIKDARKKSAIESFRGYMDAVEKTIIRDSMKTASELPNKDSNGCYNLNDLNPKIKIKGDKPVIDDDDDTLCIKDHKITSISEVSMHGYALEYKNDKILFNGKYVEDTTIPEITIGSITATKNSITIPYEVQSGKSGVTVTCEYGTSESYGNQGTIEDNKCILNGLTQDTKYYFRINSRTGKKKTASKTGNKETLCVEYAVNQQFNFGYTGGQQTFNPKCTGKYKLEVWGAQGGYGSYNYAGKGGYSVGVITFSKATSLFVYVGQNSNTENGSATFNGGGKGSQGYGSGRGGYPGGGASDIRIGENSLYARVIVAGGGGGTGGYNSYSSSWPSVLPSGGGESGITPTGGVNEKGNGGTQTAGGNGGARATASSTSTDNTYYGSGSGGGGGGWYGGGSGASGSLYGSSNLSTAGQQGSFGTGGSGISNTSSIYGWISSNGGNGGGGSGYVYTSSTASNYPSGCKLNSSNYLSNAQTIDGNTSFPAPGGSNETGHTGHGYARITYLGK